jgi:hypothetical protein
MITPAIAPAIRPAIQPAIGGRYNSALTRIVQGVFARSYIAGRDGSWTILRNTIATNPVTGAELSATGASAVTPTTANAALTTLNAAGLSLPMVGVFGARTNLATQPTSSTGLTSYASQGLGYLLAEDTSTGQHVATAPAVSLTDGATYSLRFKSKRISGVRHASVYLDRAGAERAGAIINLDTGVATQFVSGGGTVAGLTVGQASDGSYLVSMRVSNAAWGGSPVVSIRLSNIGGTPQGYSGDGTSSVLVETIQLEAASFPSSYIPTAGAAVTRDADIANWTLPVSTGQSGEISAVECPYLWSAGVNASHPSGVSARLFDSTGNFGLWRGLSQKKDAAAGTQDATAPSDADSSGVLAVRSQYWDGTKLSLFQGAVESATDSTLTPPWTTASSITIGNVSTGSREWFGFVSLIYTPGGLTAIERTAIASIFAGKTVSFAA